ncbi:MAG: BamA/TamA family outer membrane protein [Algibacter sp.]|uniref:translocation and assembly module lipoprotein TamL n=1 Tax=Algibacter sp. TaxID=1872428 RepID=UPI0026053A60|nr:BamA/TamA family outer membrane protein [Algibacter sp.]MDG1730269.1 BamA/TamA family outer membrane protein [Algibacter sp.]MDG2177681.1 BamA/TamA family outer membrane protein [Algibacter sp.]
MLTSLTSYLYSCDAVKRVTEDAHLLTKTSVIVNNKKDNTETINSLIHQKPNRKILGIPLRLHIYNTARPNRDSLFEVWLDKKPNRRERLEKRYSKKQINKLKESAVGFNNWLKKTGEAPVIVSEDKNKRSVRRVKDYYVNNGWFDVEAEYNLEKKDNKRAEVTYEVETGTPFLIDSITNIIKSPIVDSLYQNIKKKGLIQTGDQYKTSNFEQERDRIASELRNSGVYHFNQDYITFEMDTIGTNKKVNISLRIQDRAIRTADSIRREPFEIYRISNVNIITDYSFENRNKPFQDSISYGGYKLYSYGKIRYRPKALTDAVFIAPREVFRDLDRTRTYRYMNELRTFKYPNIEYIENPDNTLSDTIRLTPLKKFSLGFSTDVSQSNIQTVGFSLNPSLQIRNIFKGAETLEISGIASIGASKNGKEDDDPFFDINEFGADLKLTIPRLFSPFYTENIIPKYMSPSTRISLATTSQTNIGLDKQTFSGNFSYNWYPNTKTTNRLDLFNVQYVRNLKTDNYFRIYNNSFNALNKIARDVNFINSTDDNLIIPNGANEFINYALGTPTPSEISLTQLQTVNNIDERKDRLTEDNLILSSSFGYTKDKRTNLFDNDFSIFRFKIELAGNLLASTSKLLGLKKDSEGRFELLDVAFSQYVKTEFDYIKHWDLGKKNVLATRGFFGIAIPYGNSNSIPFAKSFFGGGPNDNRAWTAYNLGPGSSETTNEFNEANLKIAFSVEQRFNIFENLNGAIFVDAGNIWNVLDNVEDDRATFSGLDSLKDIAVGSGFGLRYDFIFFVFRFDIGFKTYDPSYRDKNRWLNDYNFANAVYNIGINYPF